MMETPRNADQSVGHKHSVDKKQSLLLFKELGFNNTRFSVTRDTVQYTGRSSRVLLHQTVEDEMQFAVGITLL
jgi:hypothetical protein